MVDQISERNQANEVKVKTKAKARYLKAKKERRKQRKATHCDAAGSGADLTNVEPAHSDYDIDVSSVVPASPPVEDARVLSEERLFKRRKVNHQEENETPASNNILPSPPSPKATLPSFPLPTPPNAPSKYDLALLGVDKALTDAEIVDSGIAMPIRVDSDKCDSGLTEKTRRRLSELGITQLFAVQTALLPFLLRDRSQNPFYLPYNAPRDICVSAPTGSGKTLAYVLPIIEILTSRIVTQLRALIVLPTRDLVTQVRETFEALGKGHGLKIVSITGQNSFAHEQAQLVNDRTSSLCGGSSKVDILICTPGRLIDHLNSTPNFSLQHLRFLVIDEADRLLAQSFQDWLAQVLAATRPPPHQLDSLDSETTVKPNQKTSVHPDVMAPAFLHLCRDVLDVRTDFDELKESSCQKLLFSATLTRDPGKIAALELRDPKYFIVREKTSSDLKPISTFENFSMPLTLAEHMIICESSRKPLMLFYLIHLNGVKNALVFTKSAESTTRLVRLLEFFEESLAGGRLVTPKRISVHAYSSDLAPLERKSILEKFRVQDIDILVCSDLISRGIDISHVSHVVSYDAPVDMRKYIHRVGRTARAGRHGDAWTLIEEQEARYFKSMMKEADHLEKLKRLRIPENSLDQLVPSYEAALARLRDLYGRSIDTR